MVLVPDAASGLSGCSRKEVSQGACSSVLSLKNTGLESRQQRPSISSYCCSSSHSGLANPCAGPVGGRKDRKSIKCLLLPRSVQEQWKPSEQNAAPEKARGSGPTAAQAGPPHNSGPGAPQHQHLGPSHALGDF